MNRIAPSARTDDTFGCRPSEAETKASRIASSEMGRPALMSETTIRPIVPCAIAAVEASARSSSAVANFGPLTIPSLHPVVGASDGRGHPGQTQAENAAGRGGTDPHVLAAPLAACGGASLRLPSLRAGWRIFAKAVRRIEDSWIGDFIGAVSLFALCWMLLLLGFAGGIG